MNQSELKHMLQRFAGIVTKMRKHQVQYFKSRNELDKKESIKYELQADEYLRLMQKKGIEPVFENDNQQKLL